MATQSVLYLKKATTSRKSVEEDIRETVQQIIEDVRTGGEDSAREYAQRFDDWHGDIVVSRASIKKAGASLTGQDREDIQFAYDRVRMFAQAQRDSMHDLAMSHDGVTVGHKHVPIKTAGCYVPGGRYSHIASAIMSITTAKVAGVNNVVACSPANAEAGIHSAVLYAMDLCGADSILALGGAHGVAALAYGLFTGHEADILVGPGNAFVAEAKRQLFGPVGIDLIAGPTESAIIADDSADPFLVSTDLVSQAEHGPDSSVRLFTTSRSVAEEVLDRVPNLIARLPDPAKQTAATAWLDHGEVLLCGTREQIVAISDQHGPEHVQVLAMDLAWWHTHLTTYGSLFLGEETTVTYGDKVTGPNHILPTKGTARYTGGLNVSQFIRTLTYQTMDRPASVHLGRVAARISRSEGMEAHARSADARISKYTNSP